MKRESLAEHLRVLRARRGLSVSQASEEIGIDWHTLRDIELGHRKPYTPTLFKIAQFYGEPVEDLMRVAESSEVEEPVEVEPTSPKAEAPTSSRKKDERPIAQALLPLDDLVGEIGGAADPASVGETMKGLKDIAAGLADLWNQDVDLYEQHERAVQPYRTLEMSSAVLFLQQQFFGALSVLQDHAQELGLSTDVSTWEVSSKQLLFDVGASIRALAELYKLIRESTAEPDIDRGNFRAMREEFAVSALEFKDPQWPETLENARAVAGLA